MKILAGILILAFLTVTYAGCKNTAQGLGRDIERAGDEIEDGLD